MRSPGSAPPVAEARTPAHVLLDTENLFWGFRTRPYGCEDRRAEQAVRLRSVVPELSPEAASWYGPVVARDVVDWLDTRFERVWSEGFGKRADEGVRSTARVLQHRGFTVTDVPAGKNMAEIALNARSDELALTAPHGHFVLGGEDSWMLNHAGAAPLVERHAWTYLVVIPDPRTVNADDFRPGRQYGSFAFTTIVDIRGERRRVRREDRDQRHAYRVFVAEHLAEQARRARHETSATFETVMAATLAVLTPQMPDPREREGAAWVGRVLDEAGVPPAISAAVQVWCLTYGYTVGSDSPAPEHECLFRAVVGVLLPRRADPRRLAAVRAVVLEADPFFDLPYDLATLDHMG